MGKQTILHGTAVLALLFLIGTSCANNDGLKAQLAAQQQMTQMQIASLQQKYQADLQHQKDLDKIACQQANPTNPQNCANIGN